MTMKTPKRTITLVAILGTAALIGCSRQEDSTTSASKPADNPPATAADEGLDNATKSAKQALDQTQEGLSDTWGDIKDATYDERASFQASVQDLSTRVGQTFDELQSKYPNAPQSAKDELKQAREKLESEISELRSATADTWHQSREEVAKAWERVQQEMADFRRENGL